jgi:hypothetical protein
MTRLRRVLPVLAVVAVVVASCGITGRDGATLTAGIASTVGRTPVPVPPTSAAVPAPTAPKPLQWGKVGPDREGITVTVARPVRRASSVPVPSSSAGVLSQVECHVLVANAGTGTVRVGLAARADLHEVAAIEQPVTPVPPGAGVHLRRVLLVPLTASSLTVQVSATVDDRAVPVGWLFAGPIG